MAEPFLSEIRLMSFNFAPKGWALCNGQLLPINQNQALFALLGTRFGGNGQTNFGLPNLQGKVPIHVGGSHQLGETAGETAHTLTMSEMPQHTHQASFSGADPVQLIPTGNIPGTVANAYAAPGAVTSLAPATVTNYGGSQVHTNMQPYLALTFAIALQGIFPSPN
ncbi:MAG TPA: tail fiber protein [Solirubrobacteraceae bacterium]|nr:tail fiber protein [Solirubrobacteraceae bacterium]